MMRRFLVTLLVGSLLCLAPVAVQPSAQGGRTSTPAASDLTLPNKPDSVKFMAMGDNGTGDRAQYDVAKQMVTWHEKFPFDMAIMLGDNMYGSQEARDFILKFEMPYRPLLDAG